MDRRTFLKSSFAATLAGGTARPQGLSPISTPNIIFMIADDLGHGDLGCYGSNIPTPNLDGMASQGVRFGQFSSANAVCSPSRAALLTGRYPTRVGVPRVLAPPDNYGLSLSETTLPQALKPLGYHTMCVGKWHLGSAPDYLPTKRGFDRFYGIPYSTDMYPLPLMSNTDVVEQPANVRTLASRYTSKAVDFINGVNASPFFLYMAYSSPHVPVVASTNFAGKSGLGGYGDAVMEIDWSVGQVLNAIKNNGLDSNTLVIFTSDHGPWYQGNPGAFRGRKGQTYEGGFRVPFIARWLNQIPAGATVSSFASMLDVFPTIAAITGAAPPAQPDGIDISPLLSGAQQSLDHNTFFYFDDWNLQCARSGPWKLHVARYNSPAWSPDPAGGRINLPLTQPELYNLDLDPQESYEVSADHPDVVAEIRAQITAALPTFPADVQSAWSNTMGRSIWPMWDASLPALKTS